MNEIRKASVVGLGKLGAPLAACLAARGFETIGVDRDPRRVEAVDRGRAPVFEPGLAEMIELGRDRLHATQDTSAAVRETDATFIVVPTPSEAGGGFSLEYVLEACQSIGQGLRSKDGRHVVTLTSTVMPGATGGPVREALERASGRTCIVDFGLCYNPEFIALGSVIEDMLEPDFVLVGESDSKSGDLLEALYGKLCRNDPRVERMNFVNAELTKLAVNTFVTTKISYANMLAEICEGLPGGDVDVVTAALGKDTRIGPRYLKGAIAYGGPCFPRDNAAFARLAEETGGDALLAKSTNRTNQRQLDRLAELVRSYLPKQGTVGILGLSYKTDTDVIEESPGIDLARRLAGEGVPVVLYDPAAMENARRELPDSVVFTGEAIECARRADVVVLTTPWSEFRELRPEELRNFGTKKTIVDCWRILQADDFAEVAEIVSIGIGPTR